MSEPSASPSTTPPASGTVPVTDRRPVPRGVLPRGLQTWLMAGLALGILLIILLAGQPTPPARPASASPTPQAPAPDRVREYQDRLRALEARAAAEALLVDDGPVPERPAFEERPSPPPEDPLVTERKRREYESLFASNVAVSRRAEPDRPATSRGGSTASRGGTGREAGQPPSIDEVADAVVRATVRAGAPSAALTSTAVATTTPSASAPGPLADATPSTTPPLSAAGPLHRVLEGTVIDTVLTHRLDGSTASPVTCLVTSPLYAHGGQAVLIPAGARVLGEMRPVQAFGDTRVAVAFHRVVFPDGRTQRLDGFPGLNPRGDAGLRDRVNHHYWSTFGAAAAVGLISGLSQWVGTAGLNRGDGDRTVVVAGGAVDATAQASAQVLARFLNRLPTVTIREGHRVKVYVARDLDLPAWTPTAPARAF